MGRKPLNQLEEKPLNAEQIDAWLAQNRAMAEHSASDPSRFTLFSLELEMKSSHGNRLVTYCDGGWWCSCAFFEDWGRCSHTMAVKLLLKDTLLPEVQDG
jgi:hypothetical protein